MSKTITSSSAIQYSDTTIFTEIPKLFPLQVYGVFVTVSPFQWLIKMVCVYFIDRGMVIIMVCYKITLSVRFCIKVTCYDYIIVVEPRNISFDFLKYIVVKIFSIVRGFWPCIRKTNIDIFFEVKKLFFKFYPCYIPIYITDYFNVIPYFISNQ